LKLYEVIVTVVDRRCYGYTVNVPDDGDNTTAEAMVREAVGADGERVSEEARLPYSDGHYVLFHESVAATSDGTRA
jgi:hypothetical protein